MRRRRLKIGIVGCGVIGEKIARAIVKDFAQDASLAAICDIDKDKAENLKNALGGKIEVCPLDKLIGKSDFVVEAASAGVSADIAAKAIAAKRAILVMSVGGLLDREDIFQKARNNGVCLHLPSGAICGLDGVKAAKISGIKKAVLTTRKPVKSLPERFSKIDKETIIFQGSARQAVKDFPQNINVAAALSLAGIGADKTWVRIIASPEYTRNTHEIEIDSGAGSIITRTENIPSPDNPKTSYLAVLSAIAVLRGVFDKVKVGT